ncbi:3-beta hydroxysteroid dehydrogenase [bacterium SCN 62-11]|nr:NAD(P)-dependent oxidoreductase [Candidatus Eremiobacteraeota bacterium]ODT67295.1 MAG: 3-beta hydroxysteroid dehydrogenase [bacterium SCN 62-11]
MKITLIGATGTVGQRILKEALQRGHQVTALVRDASKLKPEPGLKLVQGDLFDADTVAAASRGSEAVLSSYGPPPDQTETLIEATRALLQGVRQAGVQRFLMVGGAGSLLVAPGLKLVDAEVFPEAYKPIARAHEQALEILYREASDLDWANLSPAALIEPGERTTRFRLGLDQLITDAQGNSRITAEDFAIAFLDELEQPRHHRQRFTLAY